MKNKFSGKFIVLDGPDGCGKTTQAALLGKWLGEKGQAVEILRDPGGTAIGERIRQILLNPEHIAMDTTTEVMLYMAARAQLWVERIEPGLKLNKCIILDRWLSSTCAYQGYAGGFGMEKIVKIAEDCLQRPWPDLTVILDIDPKISLTRLQREFDRIEQKGDGYHQRVREGFLQLAKEQENFLVVDATGDIQTVHEKIIDAITDANFT